jgi:hypothetical protein
VPLIGAAFRRSKPRDVMLWIAHMLAYKNAFEMPNDDPDRLRSRVRIDYPIGLEPASAAACHPVDASNVACAGAGT